MTPAQTVPYRLLVDLERHGSANSINALSRRTDTTHCLVYSWIKRLEAARVIILKPSNNNGYTVTLTTTDRRLWNIATGLEQPDE